MKKQKHSLALSILLFSGFMAATFAAHADETDAQPPSRHTEAPPNSPPNTEADAPVSSQAKSKGFIEDSHVNLLLRSFTEHDEFKGAGKKDAWVLGAQAVFESGYTKGLIGLGGDVSLFGAFKLNGGVGAGNRVHVGTDGGGSNQLAWAYPGVWDVKARVSNTVLKYGQQLFDNPFLVPHDNRALPPTFRGFSLASDEIKNLTLKAGTVDGVIARGMTTVTGLTTEYGGTHVSQFTYFGGDWTRGGDTAVSLYGSVANNVWQQWYLTATQSIGDPKSVRWTGALNYYYTGAIGDKRQGSISNNAYSLALAGTHGAHTVQFAFQQIVSDQTFDYMGQSAGDYLSNSLDVDYNQPHEKSVSLSYTLNMKDYGVPGLKLTMWSAYGWGADGSAMAYGGSSQAGHYWSGGAVGAGQPIGGTHYELGVIPSYTVPDGKFKNTSVKFYYMHHHSNSAYYPDGSSDVYRLMVNVPVNVF
ncbi:OprD family outer membrane porin [Caballeronia calidae]|uniref:OprD family outer membrane porin n=2 Tax=Caballeronia calidae TaxID=1777139 RepID=A0A158B2U4_9BURK|nr:OprD family outer membrane porin [Caballeronia calidae]SAK64478.1 OprD family outer membrane porin [Caballeronia calidae]